MAYLGRPLTTASSIRKIDSISGLQNNVAVTFNLTIDGDSVSPISSYIMQVVRNGSPLEPYGQADGFTVSGSTITFTEAPLTTDNIWILLYGEAIVTATNDNEVTDSMFTRESIEYDNFTQDARSLIVGQIVIFGN
jgi:hypothetical protein